MITYKLKINQQEPRVLNSDMEFVTGDVGAYRLELEFYDNGKRMDITDSLLTVRVKRADGVCYSEGGEIVDNTGVFVPKNNLYSVPGELTLEIALSDSTGNYVTTKILTASVIKGIGDAPNGAQDDVSVYVTLLAQTKKLIDEANKLFETENSALEAQISEIEESLDTKADKETDGGGFKAGNGAGTEDSAISVGKNANAKNGGFAGGLNTFSNAGGAVGQGAKAYGYGGAVGMNTVAGKGFSGGFGAVAAKKTHDEDRVNCIQLGEGTNSVEKSLQVYSYQLMGADGKIPAARIPNSFLNFKGEVSKFSNLPNNAAEGDVYRLKNGIMFTHDFNSGLITGKFSDFFIDAQSYETPGYVFVPNRYTECFNSVDVGSKSYIYNQYGEYVTEIWRGCSTGVSLETLKPIMTGDDTAAFYLAPSGATFYTVGDLGLVYQCNARWYPVSDSGWIKNDYYTKEKVEEKISSISTFGGCISSLSQLPKNPKAGTCCYVTADISNGVKYTGVVSELFMIDDFQDGTGANVATINFEPPESCKEFWDAESGYFNVAVYSADGTYIDTLWGNPDALPPHSPIADFGIASVNDTMTFYLGIYDSTSFPSKIEAFPAGSMIFWNGTKWCAVPSASSVGDIDSALDSILFIQNTLTGGESE